MGIPLKALPAIPAPAAAASQSGIAGPKGEAAHRRSHHLPLPAMVLELEKEIAGPGGDFPGRLLQLRQYP